MESAAHPEQPNHLGVTKMALSPGAWMAIAQGTGLGLGALGTWLQGKDQDAAMADAKALDKQRQAQIDALRGGGGGGSGADYWQRQRDAEMAVLMDEGESRSRIQDYIHGMGEKFANSAEAFNPENFAAAIAANKEDEVAGNQAVIEEAIAGREDPVAAMTSGEEYQAALADMMGEADASGMDYATDVGNIQGFHRARDGEDEALRDISLMGHEGESAIKFMEEMDALRQKGLAYVPPPMPGGGGGGQIPDHLMEDIEVKVPGRGNWIATIGSLLGSAGQIWGGYNQNKKNQDLLSKWGGGE